MLINYIITAYRSLFKNKIFSFINIMGLSVGLAACLLIAQYVKHELNYDDFYENKDRIYRIQQDRFDKGVLATRWAAGCSAVGQALKENFPEVEEYVRMKNNSVVMSYGDVFFKESRGYFASEGYFKVFGGMLLKGVDSTVLKRPFTLVLSESAARKYFNDQDPIGKTLKMNRGQEFEVTGIFKDFPENSHMRPDLLYSFESIVKWRGEDVRTAWNWDGYYNYILLRKDADPASLEAKLPDFVLQKNGEDLKRYNAGVKYYLMAVTNIHLDSDFIGEFEVNGDRASTYLLMVIAGFIILIAWINYINLSTAKSVDRAKEVGIRKSVGGLRSQLAFQFLFESALLNFLAFIIALILVSIATPFFNELSGRSLDLSVLTRDNFWMVIVSVLAGGIILSGLYPAFVLSSYKPIAVLKGKFSTSGQGIYLRKGLVIVQFVATVVLIIGTFTVYHQISFMRQQEIGVAIDKTLVLRGPTVTDSTYVSKYEFFKNALTHYPEISAVTASSEVPGQSPGWNAGGIRLLTQGEDQSNQYRVVGMDYDFVDVFGLTIVAGRKFSNEYPNDKESVIFNESGVRVLGFEKAEDALNKQINFWGDTFNIVGVVKDYHQESPKKSFEPLIFRFIEDVRGYYSVKINSSDIHPIIANIKEKWSLAFPGAPLDYFFLDNHYNNQYKADLQFGKIVGLFSMLAIFIACLGLFGLSSLTALQRTKEIGVRKVLGASTSNIILLMGKDFMVLVSVAIVMALPIAWMAMHEWLKEFAYRIDLSWWLFAIPGMIVVLISAGTVGFHTMEAARNNPAQSLKCE